MHVVRAVRGAIRRGYVIQALRTLSQKLGFFVESEKGRQQLALKRIIGENILRTGYCIVPRLVKPETWAS